MILLPNQRRFIEEVAKKGQRVEVEQRRDVEHYIRFLAVIYGSSPLPFFLANALAATRKTWIIPRMGHVLDFTVDAIRLPAVVAV
jgi:hypothetical protein